MLMNSPGKLADSYSQRREGVRVVNTEPSRVKGPVQCVEPTGDRSTNYQIIVVGDVCVCVEGRARGAGKQGEG